MLDAIDTVFNYLARCIPAVAAGVVECRHCGRRQKVDPAACFRSGWPTYCGQTCMLVEAEERP
jgi:hypothetical protein